MNIVIPLAGAGSRFSNYGFISNKYMLPVNTKLETMLEKAITTLYTNISDISNFNFVFIIRKDQEHDVVPELDRIAKKENFVYKLKILDHMTEGPASTVYEARNLLDPEKALIISNSDQVLEWSAVDFFNISENFDGLVMTYKPDYELKIGSTDKHSFVKFDENGLICDVLEKIVLSDTALVGVHYFKNIDYFIDAYEYMISNNIRAPNGEFYISLVYHVMLLRSGSKKYIIGDYLMDQKNNVFYPTGEPNDYFKYLQISYKWSPINMVSSQNIISGPNFNINAVISNTNDQIEMGTLCYISDTSYKLCCNSFDLVIEHHWHTGSHKKIPFFENCSVFDEFVRGWFVGHFEKSIYRTTDFEIALLRHQKGEKWPFHYHKLATEYNILVKGSMMINDLKINENQLFIIKANEVTAPIFLEDCYIICIKVPSVASCDKYVV